MWKHIAKTLTLCTLAVIVTTSVGSAYNSVDTMNTELRATSGSLELYLPGSGQEYKLLDALVKSGSFDAGPTGALVNERILQIPSPQGNGTTAYLVLAQYFDSALAQDITSRRTEATKALVSTPPVAVQLSAVEHVVGDWGWERGTPRKMEPVAGRSVNALIDKKMSISFLKVGYVGQSATLTFFPVGSTMDQVLAEAKSDPNLAGSTIYLDKTQNQYVMYSEFFRTPQAKAGKPATGSVLAGRLLDHQPAIVVQNYEAR